MNDHFTKFRAKFQKELEKQFGPENVLRFWGNQNAKIVHIGQAPSRLGVLNQIPFSDKTGEKLRKVWYQVSDEEFYDPDNFYFTALGMYYPGKSKNGGDKPPRTDFAKIWLTQEISYLRPKLFVTIGHMAANFFFPGQKFEELIFSDQTINGVPAIILPHASPLNIKWFVDHPQFMTERLPTIRERIQAVIRSDI